MGVFVENQFTNLGIATRISRVLLAKAICLATGYGAVSLGGLISGIWLMFPVLLAAYMLLTGLTGWDPVSALDQRLKGNQSQSTPAYSDGAIA